MILSIEVPFFFYHFPKDEPCKCTCFGSTYTKIGTIQRRLAWPLRKDDTQNREAFHIFTTALSLPSLFKAIKIYS